MQHNYHPAGINTLGTFTPDNLIAGGFPAVNKSIQLKHGVNYARGVILQESSTAGIFEKVTVAANSIYVLLEDRDLTAATSAKPGVVMMTGGVNKPALSTGTLATGTLSDAYKALEAKNIYVRDTVPVVTAD